MTLRLGEEFDSLAAPPAPLRSGEERRHLELLAELAALRAELIGLVQSLPTPEVHVAAPELESLLEAISGLPAPLSPNIDANALGLAVARHMPKPADTREAMSAMAEEIKRLGKKVTAAALAGGSGSGALMPRLLSSAPVSDTGQDAIPVRIISQLGGGGSGGTVALDAPTLAALENIVVGGTVALDSATLAALENIVVSGTVALDAPTLAALESITVGGTVALDSATLAALETINAIVSGTVALDSASLAALETTELGATTIASVVGTDITTPTAMPAGGAGIRGWLSAIWTKLNGTLTVSGTVTANAGTGTMAVSAATLPLPTGAATDVQLTTSIGAQADAEATVNGSVIAVLKRLRTLLNGGLPAALAANGGLKTEGVAGGVPMPISAASLPLPTGAVLDATVTASVGAQADAEAAGNGSVIAVLKRLRTLLNGGLPAALGASGGLKIEGITGGTPQNVQVNDTATQKSTYTVAPAVSTGLLVAATAKTILSLHHAATATKTTKIRAIDVALVATTAVAGNVTMTVAQGTAAPTVAGTAVTPNPVKPGTGAAEVTAQTNPTIIAATNIVQYGFGTLAASGAIAKVRVYEWDNAAEQQPLQLRAGFLDAIALAITSSAGQTITPYITVYLTEE